MMAKKIFGFVRDSVSKHPLCGACIKAWDEDIGDDDFLGQALTDAKGYYEISYQDGLWDRAPLSADMWLPDIYITVSVRNVVDDWVIIAKSMTFKDHDLSKDLPLDMDVEIQSPVMRMTTFDPLTHGFHFINSFDLKLEIMNQKVGEWGMGLCGGMCAGALYRYLKHAPVPHDCNPPVQGTPLYTELLNRQIASMATIIPMIYDWQSAPDDAFWYRKKSIGYRTKKQWPLLKAKLDAGQPVLLILIRAAGYFGDLSENHQVVATGYQFHPTTGDLKIHLYDPNWPDCCSCIELNCGLPNDQINARYSSSENLRGFFVNPCTALAIC